MGKCPLIHSNESHLIKQSDIHKATKQLVESLNLAAGSTEGFDIYKVVETYFTNLEMRHEINSLLKITEDPAYYGEEEQLREAESVEQ